GTWSLPLIDRDEPRFAEASREMIQRADYVVPYFNNQLRLDKPPLAYWAQVASYRIFGENDFSARFPTAIAAALIALVIFAWSRRIGATSVGWWAAIIFTLSLQTFVHAKAAVADMWLVLFMTLAHWAGYELLSRSSRGAARQMPVRLGPVALYHQMRWWLTFYLSLAFGFLAKGPIAWLPLLTVGATIVLARDWELARHLKLLRGILLMLAVVALWGIPALVQTHGQFLAIGIGRHVISRSLATMEGHGASSLGMYLVLLPFYFVTILVSFFPWSIKLPWLFQQLWIQKKAGNADHGYSRNQLDNYLLTGIAIIFVIFTLVATKLPHYTLPAFPLLALLLARHWQGATANTNQGFLFRRVAIATACVWIAIALIIPTLVARFFPAYQLFRQSRQHLQPNMQFASVEFEEPSVVWYFRSRVQSFLTRLNKKNVVDFMSGPGPRLVIVPTSLVQGLFPNRPQTWKSFSTSGFNIAKGKRVDLTLVLKPE
ncbi:MAG TPA: glycosyltransferase family 39 protein, partial [Candidatus Udaeobacter sp.]|nr:glycosyltransferase family 39 protein [Candidatus Udaeobacter sp.]